MQAKKMFARKMFSVRGDALATWSWEGAVGDREATIVNFSRRLFSTISRLKISRLLQR